MPCVSLRCSNVCRQILVFQCFNTRVRTKDARRTKLFDNETDAEVDAHTQDGSVSFLSLIEQEENAAAVTRRPVLVNVYTF